MAEVSEHDLLKPGHHFGTGPYLLDLYRLLCMVLADRPLAQMEEHAITIHRLRGEFVYPELIRVLTSTATVLRILFDHYDREFAEARIKPCGELFSDWPKTQQPEHLTLREACNKIIHAAKINHDEIDPDPGDNPDQIGVYLQPFLFLYGTRDGLDWRAKLSIIEFAKIAAAALIRF
jgi:hypothetical protein